MIILLNEFKQLSLEYPTKTEAARVYKIINMHFTYRERRR